MSRVWFREDLETVATFWRVSRRDGVTLGFTTHDHDLWFDGVLHSATPGMVPSAIRRSATFDADSAEVEGALSHEAITRADLAAGRFDGAQVRIGLVDWESGDRKILYSGAIGAMTEEDGRFTAELASRKAELLIDPIPRTTPTCRARFCAEGCRLNPAPYTHDAVLVSRNLTTNAVTLSAGVAAALLVGGEVRWLDGPHAGTMMNIVDTGTGGLILDWPLEPSLAPGMRAIVRQGCDHTIETCSTRFDNAVNFQGEPFLPGNDLITRYPTPPQ